MACSSAATSTPGSIKRIGGHCVVCGKETHLRCEACSRFGTDFMYFCGEEHQKLIWFLHKKVCGNRSNPFVFPGFVESEIEDILRLASTTANVSATQESSRKRLEKWKEPIDPNLPQSDLLDLRILAYGLRMTRMPPSNGPVYFAEFMAPALENPIDHLVHSLDNVKIHEIETERSRFVSKFHHLHLVYIATTLVNARAIINGEERFHDTGYSNFQIRQFVFENLDSFQPDISSKIFKYFEGIREQAVQKCAEWAEEGRGCSNDLLNQIPVEEFCSNSRDL